MNRVLSIPMRVLCAVCFCTFSFSYLYFYQSDVMFVAQRVASGGQTHYVALAGAILITLTLQLLQYGVYAVTKLYKRFHALTYFPSFLVLAVLTHIPSNVRDTIELGIWAWLAPLLLIVFALVAWLARDLQSVEPDLRHEGPSSQLVWISLLLMGAMMLGTGLIGNADGNFHRRAAVERGLFQEVRALSEERDTIDNPVWHHLDLELNQSLMKKDLSHFARLLARRFDVTQPFPRLYAEALVLNTRFTKPPQVYWLSREMDGELDDFIRLAAEARQSDTARRQLEERYGNSYWYYYYFVL